MKHALLTACLLLFSIADASASFLWFESSGNAASSLKLDVYLHVDIDDELLGWGMHLGYDQEELSFKEIIYAESSLSDFGLNPPTAANIGASHKHPGLSRVEWIAREAAPMQAGDMLLSGDDKLLFTAVFDLHGADLGMEDLWLEFDSASPFLLGFRFGSDPEAPLTALPIMKDSTGSELLGDRGPDFSSHDPVPGESPLMLTAASLLLLAAGSRFRRLPQRSMERP
jgi:hypothetical protein